MRKIAIMFVALAGLAPAAVLAESTRIAYVNVPYLIDNSPQAEAASAELEQQFGPQQQDLQQKQQQFQELRDKLQKDGLVMAEQERTELEQRLQELRRDIQRSQKSFRDSLNEERNHALQGVREVVMTTVQTIAEEEGYDLVVGQGALYASDAVNLTSRVLDRMEARFEAQSE